MSIDAMGVDVGRRIEATDCVYTRLPSGAPMGLVQTSGALTETWTYGYDAVSNITAITKPAGSGVYGYDALDRLNGDMRFTRPRLEIHEATPRGARSPSRRSMGPTGRIKTYALATIFIGVISLGIVASLLLARRRLPSPMN